MVHYVFLALFLASAAGVAVLLYKKIPALSAIPRESLLDQEPFRLFVLRMTRKAVHEANPKRIVMHLLSWTAQFLNAARIFFLNVYHLIEALTKKARHTSQKMRWEHQWYSEKEIRKHAPAPAPHAQTPSADAGTEGEQSRQEEPQEEKEDADVAQR